MVIIDQMVKHHGKTTLGNNHIFFPVQSLSACTNILLRLIRRFNNLQVHRIFDLDCVHYPNSKCTYCWWKFGKHYKNMQQRAFPDRCNQDCVMDQILSKNRRFCASYDEITLYENLLVFSKILVQKFGKIGKIQFTVFILNLLLLNFQHL